MYYTEQLVIIKNWTYSFNAVRVPSNKYIGVINYLPRGGAAKYDDKTMPMSLYHNVIDQAYSIVRDTVHQVVRGIEDDRK